MPSLRWTRVTMTERAVVVVVADTHTFAPLYFIKHRKKANKHKRQERINSIHFNRFILSVYVFVCHRRCCWCYLLRIIFSLFFFFFFSRRRVFRRFGPPKHILVNERARSRLICMLHFLQFISSTFWFASDGFVRFYIGPAFFGAWLCDWLYTVYAVCCARYAHRTRAYTILVKCKSAETATAAERRNEPKIGSREFYNNLAKAKRKFQMRECRQQPLSVCYKPNRVEIISSYILGDDVD